jgi:Tfp pilus assembly protein PilO
MKIANIELAGWKMAAAIFVIFVAVPVMIYAFFYAPLLGDIRIRQAECESIEAKAADARNQIACLPDKDCADRMLVSGERASLAVDELAKYGKTKDVNFVSIKPGDLIADKKFDCKVMPVKVEIDAEKEQFSDFIGYLDELKKSVVTVKSFDLNRDEEGTGRIYGTVVMNMYIIGRKNEK